jgi:hypothetical protein
MTDATGKTDKSPWARLGAELPTDGAARQILLVGPGRDKDDSGIGGITDAVRWDPAGTGSRPAGPFDLVVCAGAIQADPHPANLILSLWETMAVGGTMLLHSRVLTDPEQSTYARFVAAHAGVGETEWLPGRLALRWTVETNGFDVDRWIDAGSSAPRGEDDAYLVATRTGRTPALVLATPVAVDGPSQGGDRS